MVEPASLVVTGIGELVTCRAENDSDGLGLVHDAAVVVRGGRVVFAGAARDLPGGLDDLLRLDARGRLVTPGLVDPHTHLVFAGSRAHEFDLRNQGKSYLEIQAAGGGILATVTATRAASLDALQAAALARLDRFVGHGVTVVEAKTGYDLTLAGEQRLLDATAGLRPRHAVDLSPTLLAHVPPQGDRDDYVRGFCESLIPSASDAEAVDVYCDAGAFTLAETRRILEAAKRAGKRLRVHAEQFTNTGAAELAAELGAASVEHLEQLSDGAPAKLAAAGVVCNLLPGAALTLRLPWPDAGKLYAAGCVVALGTDCNPGSSLSESQPLMMSLACTQMGLTAAQAWRGVTRAAAQALGRGDSGRLVAGARGDLVVWDADDHRQVPQHLGATLAADVVIRGRLVRRDHARVS
ncbi:MAG TPA: imidazolonepropionase [Polyangia bacterium]|nr:imidazolonepropionase [Polyangia bacterium]